MQQIIDAMLDLWEKDREYGLALTAGLSDADFVDQPRPGMNHPAWVLSHLNLYHQPIVGIIRAQSFTDPKGHRFGNGSQPIPDPAAYKSPAELRSDFDAGHRAVEAALREEGVAALGREVVLERWKASMHNVPSVLLYLMTRHQGIHLGQLSAWRRVRGLPAV